MLFIKVNVLDRQLHLGKMVTKTYPQYADEFIMYLTKILRDLYKAGIDNQRYAYKWAPLSLSYIKYKQTRHLSLKIWEATGLLRKSIVYRKRNGYYLIGIDPYRRYNNGIRVLDVAKILEYGSRTVPARPLFRPILQYVAKNIRRYWKKFLRTKGIII